MILSLKYRLLLYAFSIIVISCGKESSCFKSTGNSTIELRSISSGINVITLDDKINLVITQSNAASLSVEGGKNLLPYINTELNGNELKISSDNKCNFLRDYGKSITVYLSLPSINRIEYYGQGNISCRSKLNLSDFEFNSWGGTGNVNFNVDANEVYIHQHAGPADITFVGNSNKAFAYTLGNGWFYLKDFITKKLHIRHEGSGDIIVNVKDNLSVELLSIGNIDYYGFPDVKVITHIGSGQIIKK